MNKCPNCGCCLIIVAEDKNEEDMDSEDMDKAMSKEMKSKGKLEEYG